MYFIQESQSRTEFRFTSTPPNTYNEREKSRTIGVRAGGEGSHSFEIINFFFGQKAYDSENSFAQCNFAAVIVWFAG